MREKTYRTALGGVLSALAVCCLFLGGVLPFAAILGPAAASACVLLFLCEFGAKAAFAMYGCVALLALLLSPDRESALLFCCFLGWYPMLKAALDIRLRPLPALALKLLAGNLAVGALYWALLHLFVMPAVAEEFAAYSRAMLLLLIVTANVTFLLVDRLFSRLASLYRTRWRARLTGKR